MMESMRAGSFLIHSLHYFDFNFDFYCYDETLYPID